MVPTLFAKGEGVVVVVSGYTATSSKASERSLQMAVHLLRTQFIRIIMGEGALGEELLSTSQRMTLSHTSGNNITHFMFLFV